MLFPSIITELVPESVFLIVNLAVFPTAVGKLIVTVPPAVAASTNIIISPEV